MNQSLLELETLEGPDGASRDGGQRQIMLTLLAHPSASRVGGRAVLALDEAGAVARVSRSEPMFRGPPPASASHATASDEATPLASPFVSRKPIVLEALSDGNLALDARAFASRVEVDGLHVESIVIGVARLDQGVVLQLGTHVVLFLQRERVRPDAAAPSHDSLLGVSADMAAVRHAIASIADKPGAVLVRGETGSGKELVARALHRDSARRDKPFVAVNMAAIPSALAASQLFGHARGAFSGAERAHDGYFVQADGGTLFLDEIADTVPEVQAALLRALESGEVQPVGARVVLHVDVRVVAATDGDLETAVAAGRFRAPLFFRLATHELTMPPLRARRADIGLLLVTFLAAALDGVGQRALLEPSPTEASPWLPASLVARLARLPWPGNVRQLKSLAGVMASETGRALALDDPRWRAMIPAHDTDVRSAPRSAPRSDAPAPASKPARRPKSIDHDELEAVLEANDYGLAATAAHFGISRPSMNQLLDRHPRLRRAQRLDAAEIVAALAAEAAGGAPAWKALRVSETGLIRRVDELGLAEIKAHTREDP